LRGKVEECINHQQVAKERTNSGETGPKCDAPISKVHGKKSDRRRMSGGGKKTNRSPRGEKRRLGEPHQYCEL